LAQLLQNATRELGQLIQKEDALMRKTDFSRPRTTAASTD
jgi:hypothetical protein